MAKQSTKKTSVVNNHSAFIEIPLLSGGDNYILKPGEKKDNLDFDPETPQMRAYRHVGMLSIMSGDDVVPPEFPPEPTTGGETVTDSPSDKPAAAL